MFLKFINKFSSLFLSFAIPMHGFRISPILLLTLKLLNSTINIFHIITILFYKLMKILYAYKIYI